MTQYIIQRQKRQAKYFTEDLGNGIGLDMILIPEGTFLMGSPETELERFDNEGPQHEVTVPTFFMGRYPITQAQWRVVAAFPTVNQELNPDPSGFKGENHPVECVNWFDAVEFCARLSQRTKRNYRLPSEAEWEYACRAGTTTPFHFGKTITSELANYDPRSLITRFEFSFKAFGSGETGEYRGQPTPVDFFGIANDFGLCDMHGNVLEWCLDHWHENYKGAPINGSAWLSENENSKHVLRGGSWYFSLGRCRSAYRYQFSARYANYDIGFRVMCEMPSPSSIRVI